MVKNMPTMHETQVQSLVWEQPVEKGMATHSVLYYIYIYFFLFVRAFSVSESLKEDPEQGP